MATEKTLQDLCAVVTGAGGGLGEGIAHHAATLGMSVVVADMNLEAAERVATHLSRLGVRALAVRTDVRRADEVEALADLAFREFGHVRMLVNNAGIEAVGYSWEMPIDSWKAVIDVNIHGVVNGVRAFAPRMIAAGKGGYISNVASLGALSTLPMQAAYVMSKHAVLAFTECLALEMQAASSPIKVSAVLPGSISTQIFETLETKSAGDAGGYHLRAMRDMLVNHGMTPEEAGRLIVEGILGDKFWIFTHPELSADMAAIRAQHLKNFTLPVLMEQSRVLLKPQQ